MHRLLLLIAWLLISATQGKVKFYNCEIKLHFTNGHSTCILKDLNVTSAEKHFLLQTTQSVNDTVAVQIENSKIEVLTGDICESLPFVKLYDASEVGLSSVEENAFGKCTKMKRLYLYGNSLTNLPPRVFETNQQLTRVYLRGNQLSVTDENLFKNNKKLNHIDIESNRLRFLPTNLFKNLVNLRSLYLQDNQLSDLSFIEEIPMMKSLAFIRLSHNNLSDANVEKLLVSFPNLNKLWLDNNEFLCDRQTEMGEFLKAIISTFTMYFFK